LSKAAESLTLEEKETFWDVIANADFSQYSAKGEILEALDSSGIEIDSTLIDNLVE
jgi:hypothetical protein